MKLSHAIAACALCISVDAFAPPRIQSLSPSRPAFAIQSSQLWMKQEGDTQTTITSREEKSSTQPTPILFQQIQKNNLLSYALGAVMLMSAFTSLPADAAMSGGRMGGSFSAAPSRMISPSRGGGYGGGGGYSSGSYGYGGGGYRGSFVAPPMIYSAPPVIYGGGVGAIPVVQRGFNPLDIIFFGGFGFLLISSFLSSSGTRTPESTALGSGASVVRLSVGIDVPNRDEPGSLLNSLERMAQSANTGSREGVQALTETVAMELLRRKSSIQSATTSYEHFGDVNSAQQTFNSWSVQERSKFEQELVSKYGGVDRSSGSARAKTGDTKATMAVVTLVLSIQGDSTKVPKIRSLRDVEKALSKIASDVKVDDCLMSAEILWTPEDRNEVLSRQDIVADYPELISV